MGGGNRSNVAEAAYQPGAPARAALAFYLSPCFAAIYGALLLGEG